MKNNQNNKHKHVLFIICTQGIAKMRSLADVKGLFTIVSRPFNILKTVTGHRNGSTSRARALNRFGAFLFVVVGRISSTSRARALSLFGLQQNQVRRIGLTSRARLLSRFGVFTQVNALIRLVSSTSRARLSSLLGVLVVVSSIGLVVLSVNPVQAATSDQLNFQGRLLTSTGGLVPDGTYNFEFNLYYQDIGGTAQWTEDRLNTNTEGVTIRNGYFSVYLGEYDDFPALDWSEDLYLGMTVRGTGSCAWGACTPADAEMTPRFKLTSVPYAFRAANVASSDTNAVSTNSDGVDISTGDALGATSNSGNITIDTGTATGTAGQILLGTNNTSGLTLGRAGVTTTLQGSVSLNGAGTALTVTNNSVFNGNVTIGNATSDTLTVESNATFNGSLAVSTGDTFINQGATLNTAVAIADLPAGGAIGTAAATVDGATTFNIGQTTASQALTLPAPTNTTAGRVVYVNNVGSASFTMYGTTIGTNGSNAFIWNGTQWITTVSLSGSSVSVVGTLDSQAKSADGAVIVGNAIYLQTADATYPGLVSTGSQTFAGAKTFNGAVLASGGLTVGTGQNFVNQGSTLFSGVAVSNVAGGGNIGTAAATVDIATTFNVNQTTSGQTLTLASPTVTTSGRIAFVNNVGSVSFEMYGSVIAAGQSNTFIWNGSNWITTVSLSGSVVNVIGTIDSQTKNADGAVISGNAIYLQTADATNVGLVSTGAQTLAGAKTFNASSLVIGANGSTGATLILDDAAGQTAAVYLGAGGGQGRVQYTDAGVLQLFASGASKLEIDSNSVDILSGIALNVAGLATFNGGLTVEAGDTFTFNGDAFTDFTGGGLVNTGGVLTVDTTSATGFFQNGGNIFAGGTATLGTNDGNSLVLETDNTARLTIDASGSSTLDGDLTINNDCTLATCYALTNLVSSSYTGLNISLQNDYSEIFFDGTGTISNAVVRESNIFSADSGTINNAYGNRTIIDNYGTGSITNASGTLNVVSNSSSASSTGTLFIATENQVEAFNEGSITTAVGSNNLIRFNSNGNITNAFGVRVQAATDEGGTGAILSNVGIGIEEQATGTNNTNLLIGATTAPAGQYSIYNASTDANFFGGALQVQGLTTLNGGLAVNTTSTATSGNVYAQNNILTVSPGSASTGYYVGNNSQITSSSTNLANANLTSYRADFVYNAGVGAGNFYGIQTGGSISNAGTVVNSYTGAQIGNLSTSGGATVGTNIGINIEDRNLGTNSTNLLISTGSAPTGTFSIYNASTADNIFAGDLRIGSTTAPTVALDVTGSALISGTLGVVTLGTADTSTYLCRNTSNILSGCLGTPLTNALTDNVTDAFDLQEGTNNYININTTNGSEEIQFGNSTTNPDYTFLGTGNVEVRGGMGVGTNFANYITFVGANAGQAAEISGSGSGYGLDVSGGGAGAILTLSNGGAGTVNVGSQFAGQYQTINIGDNAGGTTNVFGGALNLQGASTGVVFSSMATDITTGTNEDLTLLANGTGIISLNDTVNISGALTVTGLTTLNGGLTVEAGDTFTFNTDAFTDFTGGGLVNTGGVLTVDATSATGFFQNGGNSFAGTATLGTNDANSLVLRTNSTTALTIDTSQNITTTGTLDVAGRGAFGNNGSIGTTSTLLGGIPIDAELSVEANLTSVADLTFTAATANILSVNPSANPATFGVLYGSINSVEIDAANTTNVENLSIFGTLGEATGQGSGNIGAIVGADFAAQNLSAGTVGTLLGVSGYAANAGTVDFAQGGDFEITNYGGGTISDARGLWVRVANVSGTITDAAGIVVEEVDGDDATNLLIGTDTIPNGADYSIYNASTRDNVFAGDLRIGSTTAPTVALDVTGSALISGTLGVTGLTTLNGGLTVEAGDTFTFNGDAFTDFTGGGLVNTGGVLTVDATSATGFFQNGGNDFGGNATLGTNTAGQSLTLETAGTARFILDSAVATLTGQGATTLTSTAALSLSSATTNALTLDSGTTGAINIGTNANAKTITIGNTTGATAINLQAGTGGISLTGTAPNGVLNSIATLSGTVASTGADRMSALKVTPTITVSAPSDIVIGGVNSAPSTSTTNLDAGSNSTLGAFGASPTYTGTGTIRNIVGYGAELYNASSGTVTNAVGFLVQNPLNPSGTIANSIGLQVTNQTAGTNNANIYIGAVGALPTGNYSIYNASTADNVFAGDLRIGSTSVPTVALDVTGSALISGTLGVTGLTTLNGGLTIEAGDTFTFNTDAFTDFTGGGLVNTGGVLTVDNSSATGFFQNGGNSFGTGAVLGTNDNNSLVLRTNSTAAITIDTSQDVTFAGSVVLAAGQTLRLTGDTTLNRPAGTPGELYYDTDTNTLLTYNGTKWVADRGEYIIVAANDSTQAEKDSADYVADGTSDETEINLALTAASGGKVLLLPGTYVADGTILIPNNTTLAGSGPGTVIELADIDVTDNLIENSDTVTGTGVVIRDLKLDGQNDLNTAGTQNGVYFNGMGAGTGASARQGGQIINLNVEDFRDSGIYLSSSSNSMIKDNYSKGNQAGHGIVLASSNNNIISGNYAQGNTYGIRTISSSDNVISNNTVQGNINAGLYTQSSSNNRISNNIVQGSLIGVYISPSSSYNTLIDNVVSDSTDKGIYLLYANYNTISTNTIRDNGSAGNNAGIEITASGFNSIINNYITDTSCTTTCDAIIIQSQFTDTSDKNYLEGNRFIGSTANAATINDTGVGTIYAGQQTNSTTSTLSDVSDFRFRGSANSTTAFAVQNASGTSILNVNTDTAGVTVGGTLTVTGANLTSLGGALTVTGLTTLNGGLTVLAGQNFTFNGDAFTDFTGGGLVNTGGVLTVDNSTASGFFQQGGNSFGTTATLGTNDANSLVLETNNQSVATFASGGAATFQNSSNSTSAFKINNAASASILEADTTNFLLKVAPTQFLSSGSTQNFAVSGSITGVDSFSTIAVDATAPGVTVNLPVPAAGGQVIGRIVYVTAVNGSEDFTLSLGGTSIDISMKANSTATLIWNGTGWTAAGASSSTDLQSAYNNTLTSAGGAELVLNASGGAADGLTIRNNSVGPIFGGLLEVQTSIGSNLFTVNNNAVEYATNGGAETQGASSSTFPTSTWDTTTGGTVDRWTTTGDNVSTGQASVRVQTTNTNHGARNRLTSALTNGLTYTVSFTVRGAVNFNTLEVLYSPDGTTSGTSACINGATVTSGQWSRITCNFVASGSINANNSMLIRQTDATSRTFYVDNLSVNINASATYAADGSVDSALGSNWTAFGALDSLTRDTSVIYDTSGSVNVDTPNAASRGVRNNLSITPAVDTQYLVTFYARSSNTFNDIRVRYSRDGGSNFVQCEDYNTQIVPTTTFSRITCLFTTDGTVASNPDLVIDQPTASDREFWVDALTITLNTNNANNVQIGGGNRGGPATLFTLDRSAGPPIAANNDAYLGSMYFDTTTGRIQCYEKDGWGACGAPPDNVVNLNPEYAGAVLNGSGVGTMTADFCSNDTALSVNTTLCDTGEAKNFYRWTSPQATQQTYSIYITYQLPETFNGFSSDDTVQLVGRVDNTSNASVTYEMFRSTGSAVTQCGTGETDIISGAGGSPNIWYSYGINGNEATSCGFNASAAGDFVIFKINMKANSNANAYVSTLSFITTGR